MFGKSNTDRGAYLRAMRSQLTILVPVYNEVECLPSTKRALDEYLRVTPLPSDVLFVDDGSTDGSLSVIAEICEGDLRYSYLSLLENGGLSTALKAGIDHVEAPWVGYVDADGQTSPVDFLRYLPYLGEYAMVNGIRAHRNDGVVKRLSSRLANRVRRALIDDGIADTGCPLKIIDTTYARRIPFFDGMHRFLPALVQLQGGRVKQLEVSHAERFAGTPKYNLLNRSVSPFIDTLAFAWMQRRNIRYAVAERSRTSPHAPASRASGPDALAMGARETAEEVR